jgi:hypothetical protein
MYWKVQKMKDRMEFWGGTDWNRIEILDFLGIGD